MKKLFILIQLLIVMIMSSNAYGEKKDLELRDFEYSMTDDLSDSFKWVYRGAYKQFQGTQNLIFASMAVLSSVYFIHNDRRISKKIVKENKNEKFLRFISDSSIVFNTPLFPLIFYGIGVSNHDRKMIKFSKEYLSATTLSLIEAALISMIPVHQRPDKKDLSYWEKAFRGQSSFPSGHVIGYTVLGFKTFQFYGPTLSILPFALATATGYERVHGEKHYISDVVASGFISLLASEGVRYAAGGKYNHPIYQWIFKHNFSINYIRQFKMKGLLLSFDY